MEQIRLEKGNEVSSAAQAADVLRAGGVVIYPTDTLYGLGADALSNDAVDKVYDIKGREEGKPINCIVHDVAMAEQYAEVDDLARMLARQFLPGALTLILKKRPGIDTGIARNMQTIGIRIPNNLFALALVSEFGRPITATSANKAGKKPERSIESILAQLGDAASKIDLIIDAEELPESKPSTVVDLTGERPIILREGAIQAAEIWDALRLEY